MRDRAAYLAISSGWGALSLAWASLVLTMSRLLLFVLTISKVASPQVTAPIPATA
jgi:hypothetical protein